MKFVNIAKIAGEDPDIEVNDNICVNMDNVNELMIYQGHGGKYILQVEYGNEDTSILAESKYWPKLNDLMNHLM